MRISIFFLGLTFLGCNADNQHKNELNYADNVESIESETRDCTALSDLKFENINGSSIALQNQKTFSGKACSYYNSGKLSTLTSFQEGAKQGVWQVYFENGQIEKEGDVSEGKEHGRYLEYFPTGQLKYVYTYDFGKKTGVWRSWYVHGGKYTERHFENDQLHGKVLVWDESGKLAKEYDYNRGTLVNSVMHVKEEN